MPEVLKRTPLHARHQLLGARFVPFAGYEMPIQYEGVVAEHQTVRGNVGLFDVSHMGELLIEGANAVPSVNRLITNDLARLPDGKGLYTCCCNEQGGILDDLIVYRLSDERVLVVCNASNRSKISAHFRSEIKGPNVEDQSDATALIAVQGPRAFDTLAKLVELGDAPGRFELRTLNVLGHSVKIARTGYTGEDGFELFCSNDAAEPLWVALLEAGADFGAKPIGLAARDTLRLEAKLALYGNDITEGTNPIEAGLSWTVKLKKADFIGQAALAAAADEGPSRKLVGFEMIGRGIARHDYPLLDEAGTRIGTCTSGSPSPTLKKNIGLGYLPVDKSEPGSKFFVDCRGRSIEARVVKTPFYRRAT